MDAARAGGGEEGGAADPGVGVARGPLVDEGAVGGQGRPCREVGRGGAVHLTAYVGIQAAVPRCAGPSVGVGGRSARLRVMNIDIHA